VAISPAEKQKTYRERKRNQRKKAPDLLDGFLRQSFSGWIDDRWSDVIADLDLIGVKETIEFPAAGDIDPFWQEEWNEGPNRGSIGCAERMVGVFLDAAVQLARFINEYKAEQVNARIAEVEAADLAAPATRQKALADMVRLSKYRDELQKQIRWNLPQWKIADA
jgi:hypothetical protein